MASIGVADRKSHKGRTDAGGPVPTPNEKLASSMAELARVLGDRRDRRVLRSSELSRTHRERLMRNGFLQRATKGWYFAADPEALQGDSTRWYGCYWEFCALYCEHRFGESWHLSAEGSLLRHAGVTTIPDQVVVRSRGASHHVVNLPGNTSLLHLVATDAAEPADVMLDGDGIRLLSIDVALVRASERFFEAHEVAVMAVLGQMGDHGPLLRRLLDGAHTTIAGRLAGAFRAAGRADIADEVVRAMRSAGHDTRETCPFGGAAPTWPPRVAEHPAAARLRLMWDRFRSVVVHTMPRAHGLPTDIVAYLAAVDDSYIQDAYHSLSIEGYRVSPELVDRVRSGTWNPSADPGDASTRDAVAALGYRRTFGQVRAAVEEVVHGANPAALVRDRHRDWYRLLFGPSVELGLLAAGDLEGYRRRPVYLSGSRHVPMRWEAVPEAMETLFELLDEEAEPSVRAVLGHFCFAYIHPYPDGNGRLARFIMNIMLASGGYSWTVVRVEDRQAYMEALEHASVGQTVEPFAEFIAENVAGAASGAGR